MEFPLSDSQQWKGIEFVLEPIEQLSIPVYIEKLLRNQIQTMTIDLEKVGMFQSLKLVA